MRTKFNLTYGSWFRDMKIIIKITSPEVSRKKHEARELYFVVVKEDDKPYCFLEINNTFFNIGFLDELNREYLRYEFSEVEPNKLFLVESQYWEYDGDTDKKIYTTMFFFNQDGSARIVNTDIITRESEEAIRHDIEVARHYEPYPEFGHYEALIKKER